MKKRLLAVLLSLLTIGTLCACGGQSKNTTNQDGLVGTTYTTVHGLKVTIFDDSPNTISIENNACTLQANKTYKMQIGLEQSGGSTPAAITSECLNFDYDQSLLQITKCSDYVEDTNYNLVGTANCVLTINDYNIYDLSITYTYELSITFVE